jgi:hypothetical protein
MEEDTSPAAKIRPRGSILGLLSNETVDSHEPVTPSIRFLNPDTITDSKPTA